MLRFVPRGNNLCLNCSMKINKTRPPKKVCTVTVCVSKVYDLNSDFFTILPFKGS